MWLFDYPEENNNPFRMDPFVLVSHLSYVDNLPFWAYPHHTHHDDFEIVFIIEGNGCLDLSSKSIPVSKGSILSIPPNTLHRLNSSEEAGMIYCTMSFHAPESGSSLEKFFHDLGIAATSAPTYTDYIHNTLKLLFNLHQHNGERIDETSQSIAFSLLQLCKELFTNNALLVQLDENYSASDILNYIMESSGKGITLESLAEHFNVSQSHLSRIFCNAYHVSPINYAIHARVSYATQYLTKTDLPINEISTLVGYDNPVHFTNMFIKRIGCTPQEYRARTRSTEISFGQRTPTETVK